MMIAYIFTHRIFTRIGDILECQYINNCLQNK